MKRFLILLSMLFCGFAYAATFNQYWYNENNTLYSQTTCTTGGDIILPTPPTKYGYDFVGWEKLQFTRIEYLESTGTQWIDTSISGLINNLSLTLKYQFTEQPLNYYGVMGNDVNDEVHTGWRFYDNGSGKIRFMNNTTNPNYIDTQINIDLNKHTVILDSLGLTYDGLLLAKNDPVNMTLSSTATVRLFNPTTNTNRIAKSKIYEFVAKRGGTIIANFIPVLDANGTPCMYDKVEGKFYYNQGTGQFIAGPVIGAE